MMRDAGVAIDDELMGNEEKMRRRHSVAAAVVLVEQVAAAVGKAAEAKTKIGKMKILYCL